MKILLAVDGSTFSDAAVDQVAARVWPAGTEIKVVSCVEPPINPATEPWAIPPTYFADIEKAAEARAAAAIDAARKKLAQGATAPTIAGEVLPGAPKRAIVEAAEHWGADLIVVGSHGYGAWDRFLLGSVSGAVATHAKCSVLIVRVPDRDK